MRYSNVPIKYIIVALLFTFEHGGFKEKKYFQPKFLFCKCHLTAGIPFGGKSLSLLHRS